MQITSNEFRSIIEYTRDQLLKQMLPVVQQNGYCTDAVGKAVVVSLPQLITLNSYMVDTGIKKEKKKVVPAVDDKGFAAFWEVYPASGNFLYRGKKFTSSRVLRSNYQICEQLYLRGLQENNITPEQMLGALKKQLHLMKEESYESGQNKLQYMAAIEPYLRQQKYMAFMRIDIEGEEYEQNNNNCA